MTTVRVGRGPTAAQLHVQREGSGEPLLWITGFAISSEIFAPVINHYAAEHDCIRYDNRGAGRSQVPWWPTSVPELAADAVRVLDALGVESAHVYGLSMGGMVAQEVALRFPDRVRALVLGGTWHGGPRVAL
ncbi:MAG: alpha/beta fold hydrolase, partial [Actinomycetes bacterium]